MRILVFFDLPSVTNNDTRNYNKFRKSLINEGFIMLQESVYSKLVMNNVQADLVKRRINKFSPVKGIIQTLVITEKQYSSIDYIIGESKTNIINDEERLIIL